MERFRYGLAFARAAAVLGTTGTGPLAGLDRGPAAKVRLRNGLVLITQVDHTSPLVVTLARQAAVTFSPTFDPGSLDEVRQSLLSLIVRMPAYLMSGGYLTHRFRALARGDHRYGLPCLGEARVIRTLSSGDLRRFHDAQMLPNRIRGVVVGDIAPEAVLKQAEPHFGRFPAGTAPRRRSVAVTPPAALRERREPSDDVQSSVHLAFVGPTLFGEAI